MHGWLVVMYSCPQSVFMQGWTEKRWPGDQKTQRRKRKTKKQIEEERKEERKKCNK